MEKVLSELDKIIALLKEEKENYKCAIKNNKKFEEVKEIYLKIKALKKRALQLKIILN